MAGLLVLAHENICQISSRGPVFRPQVKGLHECWVFFAFALVSYCSSSSLFTSRPRLDNTPKLFFALVLTQLED